ncbi:PREDICTED: 40S ribosomal protein S5 [Nipponia nippon]|uniref:40S ribosomal protein S5 n=1 Tax=Nipponia nippon TaxID=128390 RepID=UPI0005116213|nr:PREDICTED: 40S ribosomal protein S5 [Nipponia nippon]
MTDWETAPAVTETPDIKLFGKWSTDDVQINDISLQDYIAVKEKYAKYLPHSAGRYAAKRFRKAQCPIVERLTNSMMMHGRNNGKKLMTVRIVKHAFEIIHLLTGENPLQVLVNAIINSGPREDSTRIGRAGTVRRQAVDVSPLRRVNQAIWLLCTGAREAAFRNIKTIAECLADELINAAKGRSWTSSRWSLYRAVVLTVALMVGGGLVLCGVFLFFLQPLACVFRLTTGQALPSLPSPTP